MSKKSNLPKRGSEDKQLQRLVKNFNAKISRELKKNDKMQEFLPSKVNTKEILAGVESRVELNRIKRSLESFTKRGSTELVELPNGVKATKYAVDELRKSVKNFNAKNLRAFKTNDEIREYLPERVNIKSVYEKISSTKDVSRETFDFQQFAKKDALSIEKSSRGAKRLKWEVEKFERRQEEVLGEQEKERKRIKKKPVSIGGESTGISKAQMHDIKENALNQRKKNFYNMSEKEFELAVKNINNMLDAKYKAEKNEIMLENYIKGLSENGFLDNNPELEKKIRALDFDTFISTVETDETATFDFYKDPQQWEVRNEYINNAWDRAYNNYIKGVDV